MGHRTSHRRSRTAAACMALAACIDHSAAQTAPPAATAAAETAAVESIAITGSRIRSIDALASNVVTIGAKEIEQTGRVTATELLRSVPQVSNIGADDSRTSGAQRAVSNLFAGSAVNLRGLGVEATLSLVDGRRPVKGAEGRFFDIDTIPSIVLRRVDVVPDGASAIYGSDAVTGVVNLLPYHSYDGITVRAFGGHANELNQTVFSAMGGKSWSSGGFVLAGEHGRRSHLLATDRPRLYDDSVSTSGTVGRSTNSSPGNLRIGANTRPILDANNDGILSAAEYAASNASSNVNLQSNWLGVDALPQQKRDSVFGYIEQELTDRLHLYGEAFYSKRRFVRMNAPPTSTLTVPASNHHNQTGVAAPLSVLYSFINDLGAVQASGYQRSEQITGGLKYDIGGDWQAEAYYSDGKTVNDQRATNQINNTALTAALANATPAAFSAFGRGGINQAATLAAIAGGSGAHNDGDLGNGSVKVDGPLFKLPGGAVRLAAGAEYLREKRAAYTTSTASGANVNTEVLAVSPTVKRRVESAYVELFAPLVGAANALPGLQRLQLAAAVRSDDYRDTAPSVDTVLLDKRTTNPKFSLAWQPVDDLTLRGSYGKSFRAPSLGDYAYGAPTFQAAGSAAAVPHAAGLFGLPNGPVAAVLIQGGRLSSGVLTPEKGKTWTLGAEIAPRQVPGLDLSATYYRIEYTNQIQTAATNASFTDPAYAGALVAAGLAVPNPTTAQLQQYLAFGGSLTPHVGPPSALLYGSGSAPVGPQSVPIYLLIDSRSINSGVVQTSGWDLSARYVMRSPVGSWTLADNTTYVRKFEQSLLPGSPLIAYRNTYGYPLKLVSRAQLGWEWQGANANLFANYVNSYTNTQVTPNVSIASYTTFDVTLGYDLGPQLRNWGFGSLTLQVGARNALDRKPPYALVGSPAQTFDTQNASAIGRLLTLSIQGRW